MSESIPSAPHRRRRRHVKNSPQGQKNRKALSKELAEIRDLIQIGAHGDAMARLDGLASRADRRDVRARILNLVGISREKQGKTQEAAHIFGQAHQEAELDVRGWLQPRLCQLRVLLKSLRVEEAEILAGQIWEKTSAQEREQEDIYRQLERDLRSRGRARVGRRPVRASVTAYRIGQAFLEEGESITAERYFLRAVQINPNGASRSRQSLAELALRKSDGATAMRRAAEALILGKFQAKTVSAWPLYLRGLKSAGGKKIDVRLLQALNRARPPIRARSMVAIVQEMRRQGLQDWRPLAATWLEKEGASFPTEAAALRSILLAEARLQKDHQQVEQAGQAWKDTPGLTVVEYLASIKALTAHRARNKQPLELEQWIEEGVSRFGTKSRGKLRHGLALTCVADGLESHAVAWFEQNARELPPQDGSWGRSLWRLAVLHMEAKRWTEAVTWFKRFYENTHAPDRLRLTARLKAVSCLLHAGRPDLFAELRPALEDAVARTQHWETALDLARHLSLAPQEFQSLTAQCWAKARSLSLAAFEKAPDAASASEVLFKLARRQNDFADFAGTLAVWNGLSAAKRDWLWNESAAFWDYLGYVIRAHAQTGQAEAAAACVAPYLERADTPGYGRSVLQLSLGLVWMKANRAPQGLPLIESGLQMHPTHEAAAYGWYWMSLRAWKQKQPAFARQNAARIRSILPENTRLQWSLSLLRRGRLLETSWDQAALDQIKDPKERKIWMKEAGKIQRDLQRL